MLGPEEDWLHEPLPVAAGRPRPSVAWRGRQAVGLLLVVVGLGGAVMGGRWVSGYDPLRSGPTFGLKGEVQQVAAGDDVPGTGPQLAGATLPYRDGAVQTWTYSLVNSGHLDVEVLSIEQPQTFHAELVQAAITHAGQRARLPVVLQPGQTLRVDLSLRSVRCEQGQEGIRHVFTGVLVRQRALGLVRERLVPLAQSLAVGIDTAGSTRCPRPSVVPPAPPAAPGDGPPY